MSREAVNCENVPKYTTEEDGFKTAITVYGQVAEITGDSLETVCNMCEQERQDIISVSGLHQDKDVFSVNAGVGNCNKRRRTLSRRSTGDTTKRVRGVNPGLDQEEIVQILDRSNSPNSSCVGSTPLVDTDSQSPIFRKMTNKPVARVSNCPGDIVTENKNSTPVRFFIDGEINANSIERKDVVHEATDVTITAEDDLELTYQENILRLQDIFITKSKICGPEFTSSPEFLSSPLSRLPTHLALLRARQLTVYRPCYVQHSRRKESLELQDVKFGSVMAGVRRLGSFMAGVRRKSLSHSSSDCVPVWKPLSGIKCGKKQIVKRTKERPMRECRRKNETFVETNVTDDDDFIAPSTNKDVFEARFRVKSQGEDIFDDMSNNITSKQIGKKIKEKPQNASDDGDFIPPSASTSRDAFVAGFNVHSQNENIFYDISKNKTSKQTIKERPKRKYRRKNKAALKTAATLDDEDDLFAPSTSKDAFAAGFNVKSQNEDIFDELLNTTTFKESSNTMKTFKFFPSKAATKINVNTKKLANNGLKSTSGSMNTSGMSGGDECVVSDEDVQFVAQKLVRPGSVSPCTSHGSESRNVEVKEEQVPLRRCPLCNEIFNDVMKLETHASNCDGDW